MSLIIAGLLYNITSSTLLWYWWYISMIVIPLYWYILAIYLYFFIDFIALYYVSGFHAASSMSWYLSFMYAYIVLYAFKYLYDDTYARTYILYIFTYLIYAFIWHLLSSLHAFMTSMLLYFYMIHISLQPPVLAPVLSSIWEVYTFTLWESVALVLNAHEIHQGIYFLYTFLALYMIYCTNYVPAFI